MEYQKWKTEVERPKVLFPLGEGGRGIDKTHCEHVVMRWKTEEKDGRAERIRTSGLFVPNEARYLTALQPDIFLKCKDKKIIVILVNVIMQLLTNHNNVVIKNQH